MSRHSGFPLFHLKLHFVLVLEERPVMNFDAFLEFPLLQRIKYLSSLGVYGSPVARVVK
jgi:hypothetical protein